MIKTLFLTLCLFMATGAPARAQDVTTGLIGYWGMNETSGTTIVDQIGGATGTMQGSMTAAGSTVEGKAGKALDFNGSSHYISLGDLNYLDGVSQFTFSAWVRFDANVDFAAVFSKRVDPSNRIAIQLGSNAEGGNDDIVAIVGNGANSYGYTTGNIIDHDWHLWTMVYDGTQTGNASRLKFYLDGALKTMTFVSTIPATTNSNAAIAELSRLGGLYQMDGRIDDVRIYNRALSAADVTALYGAIAGRIRYNTAYNVIEYFSGQRWISMWQSNGSPAVCGSTQAWTARAAAEANQWVSGIYANGQFVALANSGTNRVMTSPDGITWTARAVPEANSWRSMAYGNGLYVAVANSGANRVMTSPDAITWTARAAAEANSWFSVVYANSLFVAVANTGSSNRVMTSPDGITWTARAVPEANSWTRVAYGNGLFVAVAQDGTNRVMTSPDGITWTARAVPEANTWTGLAYGSNQFVAVAGDGTNRVMTSPDGITWTARSAPANGWNRVAYGNGLFVAVSGDGPNRVMSSPDGITWTAQPAAEDNAWRGITYGNGLFVAFAFDGTNRVMTASCNPASCTSPARPAGTIVYNTTHHMMQGCAAGTWMAIAKKIDSTPDVFGFNDLTGIALSTQTPSNIVQMTGFVGSAAVSISGSGSPQYRTCSNVSCTTEVQTWGSVSGTIAAGNYLQLRLTSNASYGTANSATVMVGGLSDNWSVTSVAQDTTPDSFNFTDQTGVAQATLITSNTVTINGITGTVNVAVAGDGSPQININGGGWVTSGTITNGQTLQMRLTSGGFNETRIATVTVGTFSEQWSVSTGSQDTTPDPFNFTDVTGQALNTVIASNSLSITGITGSVSVSVSGAGSPEVRINGGSWVTSGSITNGQTLEVRLTSANAESTLRSATVTVGTGSNQWDVTTQDLTPNSFNFTDVIGQAWNTVITSNSLTINGITGSVNVSVSGTGSPQVSINGGGWTTSGTITNGQSLQVRLTSSSSGGTMRSATVTVGTGSNQWDVTTRNISVWEKTAEYSLASNQTAPYSATSLSFGAASANRHIVCAISIHGNTPSVNTISAVTIGGVSATIVRQTYVSDGARAIISAIAIAAVPTGTTGTVTVAAGGGQMNGIGLSVYRMVGAVSATPVDTAADTSGAPGDIDIDLDTINGGAMVAVVTTRDSSTNTWSGPSPNPENNDIDFDSNDYHSAASVYPTLTATPQILGANNDTTATGMSGVSASWQ